MRADKRPIDPHFHPDEFLFRRVPTALWEDPGEELSLDAIELPDISVGRSKYGHPEWVRFDVLNDAHYEDWGVVGVQVCDVPPEKWKVGVFHFTFHTHHSPLELDYPHSEIRAYEDGARIVLIEHIPEDVHLVWREHLRRKIKVIIKPFQKVNVRQKAPTSHKLEPFTVPS